MGCCSEKKKQCKNFEKFIPIHVLGNFNVSTTN
jgi:hypothetical protein